MDESFQSLLSRLDNLSDEFHELRDGIRRAIRIAEDDPEMALTRARKVLEYVVRDIYSQRYNEEPGTRPLENLLQRLSRDGHFPSRLNAYANSIRMLGNVGTHSFGERVTTTDVHQSLTQLMPILEWYFESAGPQALKRSGDGGAAFQGGGAFLRELEDKQGQELAGLRMRLLNSPSRWELQQLLYEAEGFLSRNPLKIEARQFKDQVTEAIRRQDLMTPQYTQMPTASSRPPVPYAQATPGKGRTPLLAIILALGVLLVALYFLLRWLL